MSNNNNTTTNSKTEFSGKYRLAMAELYGFLTSGVGVTPEKAVKISHAFACDFGAAVKNGKTEVSVKVGRMGKEQLGNLTDVLKTTSKGAYMTVPMQLAHAAQWAGEAGKHGIAYSHTRWELSKPLQAWIDELEVKVSPVEQPPVEQAPVEQAESAPVNS